MTQRQVLGILGPGALGLSAAQWAAEKGLEVRLLGRNQEHASRGLAEIERRWLAAIHKGRISAQERCEARERLSAHACDEKALAGLEGLLEAVPEDFQIKTTVWASLHPRLAPETLRLSGTSSLPIAELDEAANLGGTLMGFHLFLPVERMGVMELVSPTGGAETTRAMALARTLGKRVVPVKDGPGFAAARMALVQGLEAMRLWEAGVATVEDLDALMVMGYGHPVGPFELTDRIGLDLRLRITERLFEATGDARYEPPAVLKSKVAAGELGRKVGRGFYEWDTMGRRLG